jgi:hypothetical protein
VTIEGQLLSVRTVINMLHFLNQLIVYTIRKLAFSKLTKITPLNCSPFYQYNVCQSDKCLKLMKVLKNNLAKDDIFVISGYGPFIFIRPSKYGLIFVYENNMHNSALS